MLELKWRAKRTEFEDLTDQGYKIITRNVFYFAKIKDPCAWTVDEVFNWAGK